MILYLNVISLHIQTLTLAIFLSLFIAELQNQEACQEQLYQFAPRDDLTGVYTVYKLGKENPMLKPNISIMGFIYINNDDDSRQTAEAEDLVILNKSEIRRKKNRKNKDKILCCI